ncbi:MAG TPA: glutamate--tRNA ligase [Candidatus Saccharimonadales bacterium]|nr:glutamate--tRNA ligase [Candidatus Saccharimonadales bacterium]
MSTVRTRFAPSPTGFLHIGGVRTALFNYLWARHSGGQFLLRLEDTDRERFVPAGVQQLVDTLEWLGLQPDEGFWISEGRHQSIEYVQSERHVRGVYQKQADRLVGQGTAYRDWTSSDRLAELRAQAQQAKRPFVFRKSMAQLDGDPAQPHVIRFDAAAAAAGRDTIGWDDAVRGHLQVAAEGIDDFVIIKSDGFPTYNFANVVDDHDMAISHVLRGEEIIPSTPKHLLLYDALGFDKPVFAHLPVINGADGKKLSKRTGDTNALNYRDRGYPPEALLNFLALLGWNDGSEQEIYELDELAAQFELKDINASPAVFDAKRLDWVSGYWIRERLPADELYARAAGFWPPAAADSDEAYKKQVLAIVRDRLKYFAELPELTGFFFAEPPLNPELITGHKQLKKYSNDELKTWLEQSRTSLSDSDFSVDDLTKRLNDLLEQTGQKPAVLFSLIRIATTQAAASPGLADTLAVLGRDRSLQRIDRQLRAFG